MTHMRKLGAVQIRGGSSALLVLWLILSCVLQTGYGAEPSPRPLIGYLSTHTTWVDHYREALAELGYVDGKNVTLVWRGGDDQLDQLPAHARELVNLRVHLILVDSTLSARAAKGETDSVPIVLSHVADPVGFGLVTSLAHPAGNVTGVTSMTLDVTAKRLQLLKDVAPHLSRVALLWRPDNPLAKSQLEDAGTAAPQLQLKLQKIMARDAAELQSAFESIPNPKRVGLLVTDDTLYWNLFPQIAAQSVKRSMLGIAGNRLFPESGGLMSYGASPKEQYQRAAAYIDRILKGAQPKDLPIERATKIELVINLGTAKALGISLPQSILLRADEVIRQ